VHFTARARSREKISFIAQADFVEPYSTSIFFHRVTACRSWQMNDIRDAHDA
jgi:hypothetical protein